MPLTTIHSANTYTLTFIAQVSDSHSVRLALTSAKISLFLLPVRERERNPRISQILTLSLKSLPSLSYVSHISLTPTLSRLSPSFLCHSIRLTLPPVSQRMAKHKSVVVFRKNAMKTDRVDSRVIEIVCNRSDVWLRLWLFLLIRIFCSISAHSYQSVPKCHWVC